MQAARFSNPNFMAQVADNTQVFTEGVPTQEECSRLKIGIVAAEWNDNVIAPLLQGAVETLEACGVSREKIYITRVPGTVELTFGARRQIEELSPDAVIVLGCVVRGDTPHFDYVCESVTQGVTLLNATPRCHQPVIFGVITTNNMQQALDRAGGCVGNKGSECAVTALKMCALKAATLSGKVKELP